MKESEMSYEEMEIAVPKLEKAQTKHGFDKDRHMRIKRYKAAMEEMGPTEEDLMGT